MRWVASALLLACTGCMPGAPENAANASANIVENVTVIEDTDEAPPPAVNEAETVNAATTEAAAGANGLPAEVQTFIERREGCEHWAGEPDFDEARRKQIEDAVKELCPGIDTQLEALRKRYSKDPEVVAALKDFEPLGMEP
ncbi:hypothetical protein OF829_05690 [Sphingomonas sp. LB-2]|uniref:hypothetical protein n=1 Tax=Sphingomonas caeni TaxID=2984949 RepID=UPI00222FDE1D|nr:hypothetical protein [Sphingomonas caeni]MCW3846723.1 hypothetical protein [Sphingomonas caeni]